MTILANELSISRQDVALLSKCKQFRFESMTSVIRRVATTHVDGKRGFSGKGFLLFGKSFPMSGASRREIYVRIVQCIYDMDPKTLGNFFEKTETEFRQDHRRTIRPIGKSLEDLYLYKSRKNKPYQRLGDYFIATSDNNGVYEYWLGLLLRANGLDVSELMVFWE